MRISTIQTFNNGNQGIQDNYAKVTRTQEQVSSGKRLLSPADDPVATVRLLQLDQEAGRLEQFKSNMSAATNSLNQEEATLNSVTNILQRVREITLQAGNGALDASDRQALAQELTEREEELFGLFNSRNARGEYLFGGFQSQTPPFVREPNGTYTYEGDQGQRSIQIAGSKQLAINDNGKDLFVDVGNVNRVVTERTLPADPAVPFPRISLGVVEDKTTYDTKFYPNNTLSISIGPGNTYTITGDAPVPGPGDPGYPSAVPVSGTFEPNEENNLQIRIAGVVVNLDGALQDGDTFTIKPGDTDDTGEKRSILQNIAFLRETLEDPGNSPEDKLLRRDKLAISLENVDNAMNSVLSVQTSIGARLNVIESTGNENAEVSLINTKVQAELSELDYAEALSRLSLESVVLQAAQQSYVKISGLSLFNLLR
ncbi:flagellar hook-associated protein FlgL [Halopseudomonas salina]|uniref:Flagellar hook-associated protein FlgL n=1 Tax=Halopseudomonas salina TaxID=1323744 RepID=A0ABQ1NZM7_9GAMM|nr:flagellar hook-associated protein FlgL [Halopseudomonas salina]GGC87854.1 flagellar hook-associated protein FlgL [Halopseudomonas salina]